MIRESLILGTLWSLWDALGRSSAGRAFDALCRRIGVLWHESAIVSWFCEPRCLARMENAAPGRLRAGLCALYARLKLDRLFAGSIFLHSFWWCAFAVVAAAAAPTMGLLGLVMVGYGSTALALLHKRERRLTREPLTPPVLLYAACYLVGTFTSVNVRGSLLVGFLTVVFVGFTIVLCRSVDTREQLDLLVALLVTVAAAISVYGILQYFFHWGYQSEAWVDEDMFSEIQFRVSGTMQNPNMMGQYLVLMIPLGGAKLLGAKDFKRAAYYFVCCALMCVCMILTFSRGAWLGLLLAGLVFFVLLRPRLLFLAPVALLALWVLLPATVVERFTSIGNLSDSSTSYRVSIWLGTINMLRHGYWLKGIGPGTAAFNDIYPMFSYAASYTQHAHNLYLQLLCDAGIVGLLAFLWVILRYYRVLCGALRRGPEFPTRLLQIAFASGAAGFLVQAMTDYSFYNYRVMFLFWAYLALGMLAARRDSLPEGGVGRKAV